MTFYELSKQQKAEQIAQLILKNRSSSTYTDKRTRELIRQREVRSEAAKVVIPEPADIVRREKCLEDPELFLKTYFSPIFYNPFAEHHKAMINAIYERCFSGGDKAVAAPRGDGKSQVAICMTIYAMLATPIQFPVIIGNTLSKGRKLFQQVKNKFDNPSKYPEFYQDFPEITYCVSELQGTPQRAAKQHVDGIRTNITWSQHLIVLPTVNTTWNSVATGKRLVFFGLDSAIRGEGFEEMRPDLAIIDDPETREVAFSPTDKHRDIEEMIDSDVAGLAGPDKRISRVVITTIQNRRCYSFRVTDRKQKPTFEGERYPLLKKFPDNRDLWDDYLAIRAKEQQEGKKDSPAATKFYKKNMRKMKKGAVLSNPYRFVGATDEKGNPVELDALQAFFNRISDWGMSRVLSELQQQPEEEEEPETLKLTPGAVITRMSGLRRNELPKADDIKIIYGVDLGKYACHWVKIAVHGNAIAHVVDYGIIENHSMSANTPIETVERSLVNRLDEWRQDIIQNQNPDLVFIDSGNFSQAVYHFVRQAGFPFCAAKGVSETVKMSGNDTNTQRFFENIRADYQPNEKLWLYNVSVNYWKEQVQQRFKTATFNELNQLTDGALSLWSTSDPKEHLSYSHHICAEEKRETFKSGRGIKTEWVVVNRNNHWLDATSYALAGAACLGIKLIPVQTTLSQIKSPTTPQNRIKPNLRKRNGGWIKGMRR
jgi:hypothetical protein